MSGNRLIRLNPDGTMDEEFDAGGISGVAVSAVVPLNDGKILVGINGPLPDREGKMRSLVQLTSRGELDSEFLIEQRQFRMVTCLHVADNGQILTGGYELRRLNQDGKINGNFVVPVDGHAISAIVVQPDRNIILGGPFDGVARMPRKYLARVFGSDQAPSLEFFGPFFTRGRFELAVPTYPGKKYLLEYKNALQEARWSPLSTLQGDGTFQTVVDSPDGVPGRFYRLRTE